MRAGSVLLLFCVRFTCAAAAPETLGPEGTLPTRCADPAVQSGDCVEWRRFKAQEAAARRCTEAGGFDPDKWTVYKHRCKLPEDEDIRNKLMKWYFCVMRAKEEISADGETARDERCLEPPPEGQDPRVTKRIEERCNGRARVEACRQEKMPEFGGTPEASALAYKLCDCKVCNNVP